MSSWQSVRAESGRLRFQQVPAVCDCTERSKCDKGPVKETIKRVLGATQQLFRDGRLPPCSRLQLAEFGQSDFNPAMHTRATVISVSKSRVNSGPYNTLKRCQGHLYLLLFMKDKLWNNSGS